MERHEEVVACSDCKGKGCARCNNTGMRIVSIYVEDKKVDDRKDGDDDRRE